MKYKLLFPGGKHKALTFSYDDGQIHDYRLIKIMRKYQLRGTFHLNTQSIDKKGFISRNQIPSLYQGMEIAGHGMNHKYLSRLPRTEMMAEVIEDKKALEDIAGESVRGFSYPYGDYNEKVMVTVKKAGLEYARTTLSTFDFGWPENFLRWHPTCHDKQLTEEMIKYFISSSESGMLLYIWGHSFEFARDDTWDHFESICRWLAEDPATWYAVNIEVKEYIQAARNLVVSGERIYNLSPQDIFLMDQNRMVILKSGMAIE